MTEFSPQASTLELTAPNGANFAVNLGLPENMAVPYGEDYTLYGVPEEPYVFTADRAVVENPQDLNNPLLDERNLKVLFMHGIWKDGNWVPKSDDLQAQGVTMPDLVTAYEQSTGERLDVLFVCKTGSTQEETAEISSEYPYIHPHYGRASGRVFRQGGEVNVVLTASTPDSAIDYASWQANR